MKKRRPKGNLEKSPITDIDPIKGVTPEQLIAQTIYLLSTIPASFNLEEDVKNDIIHNSVIRILKKMEDGDVDKFNYEKFKDYFFIIIKNEVLAKHAAKKQRRISFNNDMISSDEINFDTLGLNICDNDGLLKLEMINDFKLKSQAITDAIQTLNTLDREIVGFYLKGLKRSETIAKLNITISIYSMAFVRLKKKIVKMSKAGYQMGELAKNFRYSYNKKQKKPNINPKTKHYMTEREILKELFPRHEFYGQTEAYLKFKIGVARLKKLIEEHNIPVINRECDLGEYKVTGIYLRKEDIDKLGLPLRKK